MVVYQKAADQGQAYAQYKLGVLYSNGLGVAQDHVAARAWYEKAAKQGNAAAQDNLGVLYHNGQGGLQDDVYARYLFREAATQGYAGAQNNLGLLYLKGLGGPQDNAYARALFRKAAEQGYATAQYNLGRLYENGQGGHRTIQRLESGIAKQRTKVMWMLRPDSPPSIPMATKNTEEGINREHNGEALVMLRSFVNKKRLSRCWNHRSLGLPAFWN